MQAADNCLSAPEVCLADEQYVTITTPLTIKGSSASTLWDMGYETRRIIAAADIVMEDLRLQGFSKDVTPNIFFFIFHDADLLCKNCWIEDGCSGGHAKEVLTGLQAVCSYQLGL